MNTPTKASEWLKALNSRTVGYVWFNLSILLISMGNNATILVAGGISLGICLTMCIMGQGAERSWSNYRQHGWEGGTWKEDDQPITNGIGFGFMVSFCYYIVVYAVSYTHLTLPTILLV